MKTNILIGGLALALLAATVPVGAYHPVSTANRGFIQVEDLVILCETDGPSDPYNGGELNAVAHPGLGGMCFATGNPSPGPVTCTPGSPVPLPVCTTPAPALSGGFSTITVEATLVFRMSPVPSIPSGPETRNVPFHWAVADQFGLADEQGVCVDDDYAQINDDGHISIFVPLAYVEFDAAGTGSQAIWLVPAGATGAYTATPGACNAAFVDVSVDGFGNPLGVVFADWDAQDDLAA